MPAKVPDHLFSNPMAEAALLGWVLERRVGLGAAAVLSPDDFSDPQHRAVFAAMQKCGDSFDPIVVERELRRGNAQIGFLYLMQIIEQAGAAPERHVEILQECSRRRRLDSI